jgi:predicted Zn-dependent peptidase
LTEAPHRVSELPSGIRVATEAIPSVRSVALGMWVRTGSRDEPTELAGVSHFLEHMLFKGTERYTAIEISELFDGLGATVNAATGKESTYLHARCVDVHTERVFEVLSEMLLGPTYPEVDSERAVVLEEIAMYEDEPMDKVHDILGEAVFGDHPLGRRVIGAADVIGSISVPDVAAYHDRRYVAPNIVVAAAGHLDHEEIAALADRHLAPRAEAAADTVQPPPEGLIAPNVRFQAKETEQYHVCLGGPGIDRHDDRRFALGVLDAAFGGSTSSRLFREVREKRGLAYSVGSYSEQFQDSGMIGLYVGTREENVEEACTVIGGELARLQSDGVSGEELARAKEQVKGRLVLAMESTAARMTRLGRTVLFDAELLTLDEMLARVDAVSDQDVAALARELYAPATLSAACIGTSEDRFRAALASVDDALATA